MFIEQLQNTEGSLSKQFAFLQILVLFSADVLHLLFKDLSTFLQSAVDFTKKAR